MSQLFSVIDKDLSPFLIQRIAALTGEKESKITELAPTWEAIILGGLLKLVKNRIQFNALQNFILQKSFSEQHFSPIISSSSSSLNLDEIIRYGEGLMSILIPDKKSAIAMLMSRELTCKSSTYLKGLSIYFALYGYKLKKEEYSILTDWKSFGIYIIQKQHDFSALCPSKLLKPISEILLLSDVLKLDLDSISYQNEEVESKENNETDNRAKGKPLAIILWILLMTGIAVVGYWYFYYQSKPTDNLITESQEMIPIDSLNKLNDSLTKAVLDSNRILNDSTIALKWPDGNQVWVPKKSILVQLHQYLTDSTQVEPLEIRTFELAFGADTDLLTKPTDYLFKHVASFLNRSKSSKIKVIGFAVNNDKSALNRAFIVKNRLVGEGLSIKRIEVKGNDANYNLDANYADNKQVLFIFSKHNY